MLTKKFQSTHSTPSFNPVQKIISHVREFILNQVDDPLGMKKHSWEEYDKLVKEVTTNPSNTINRKFLILDKLAPQYPRPRSMTQKK